MVSHIIVACFIFEGAVILFFRVATPFYIPTKPSMSDSVSLNPHQYS